MSVVDEIKGRLDIAAYIQQYAQLKKAGRYYKACCPFHSEKTPSFTVNPDSQTWRCFGACAEGGDIFSFAMKMHSWSFAETVQELGRLAGVETRQQTPEQRQQSDALDHLRGLLKVAAEFYQQQFSESPEGAAALRYAREKRGFTDDTIAKFQIGYAPAGWQNLLNELKTLGYTEDQALDAGVVTRNDKGSVYDRFRNRLMIPIRDERGRVIGFGARALDPNDTPKYLNSPQSVMFDKSKTLFGLDTGKKAIRDIETAVIVEGYMDAIQAQQAGFTNVVAQMGTALTETQLQLLAPRYAKRIILALDSDAAGQNATMRSLEVARQALQADYAGRLAVDMRVLRIPGAKDPDDLIRENPERWQEFVDQAVPVADYVIELETADLNPSSTVQEREAVARQVLPMLIASESDLYRKDNLQKLAMRLRIAERDLLVWAQEQQIQEQRKPRPVQPPAPEPDTPYMPPINYDTMLPPSDEDGEERVSDRLVILPARVATIQREYALEFYCLRILLLQPDLLYTVNRKFRELAKENQALIRGVLGDLSVDDFQHGDYRGFIHMLKLATRQDDLDVLAFVRTQLNPALLPEFERLFTDEADAVRERLRRRFDGDAIVSWKQHERHKVGMIDPVIELLDKALRLRLLRLQRETQEMQFLQMEADTAGSEHYIQP
ncbi:MAG: DNA primase, partial [Anaerolineae bacterium]|nr:DNA primase [Anaerolineae bacterium]